MIEVFAVVAPVFAVIAAGWICARLGFVPERIEKLITQIVFGFAIPVLLFRTMVNVSGPEASPWALWTAYFSGVAVAWCATYAWVRTYAGGTQVQASMAALGACYSNTVLIGIPLVFSFFGEAEGALPLFIILSIHLPVMMVLGTLSIEWSHAAERTSAGALALQTAKGLATNPVVIGLLSGLAYRQTGWGIPAPADWAMGWVAWAAVPAALFTMGVSLNRFGVAGEASVFAVVLANKLVVHPLVVAALAIWVLDLPHVWAGVAVLFAAAPTGINTFLLASRYQVGMAATSAAIALGTAVSVVTITVISWGFGFQSG